MANKKPKSLYKKRVFLNDDLEMAGFVIAIIEEFITNKKGVPYSYPTFTLSDCSNKIYLDFGFSDLQEMRRSLKKIRLLRGVIENFANHFESEAARIESTILEKKEKKVKNDRSTSRKDNTGA